MEKIEFANACTEVLNILKYIKDEDLNKIPQFEIDNLKYNANTNYKFEYDCKKNINEQNISKLAKTIIAIYFCDYIATPRQKKMVNDKQKYDEMMLENEKRKLYNSENIFRIENTKNNLSWQNEIIQTENVALIETKHIKWYKKIWNKILSLFKREK